MLETKISADFRGLNSRVIFGIFRQIHPVFFFFVCERERERERENVHANRSRLPGLWTSVIQRIPGGTHYFPRFIA